MGNVKVRDLEVDEYPLVRLILTYDIKGGSEAKNVHDGPGGIDDNMDSLDWIHAGKSVWMWCQREGGDCDRAIAEVRKYFEELQHEKDVDFKNAYVFHVSNTIDLVSEGLRA